MTEKRNITTSVIEWIQAIVIALALALLIKFFIMDATEVNGNSMNDTLHHQDRLLVNKIVMRFDSLKRGEIITLKAPDLAGKDYIKRVIGLPGENVRIQSGLVYINGVRLEEDYINTKDTSVYDGDFEWQVGEDEVFVMGDNRLPGASKDSRFFGPIKQDTVIGVAIFRFFPFGKSFGTIH